MKMFLYIGCLISMSGFWIHQNGLPNNLPIHFDSYKEWALVEKSQHAFYFKSGDTAIEHEMYLLQDKSGSPLMFYADIKTPVCIDGLCKPLSIEMYWNLLGEYAGYGVYPQKILTKFDHEIFEGEDYLKLHELLVDDNSVLGRRKLSELYDNDKSREKAVTFKGVEVDAISGATRKEIKSSVVDGALYSCYALYHLVYGRAADRIRSYLPGIYSDTLAGNFLKSDHIDYHYYALRHMPADEFIKNIELLIPVFKKAKPITRAYILKKMPKALFNHPLVVDGLYRKFSFWDNNSKTLLVNNLIYANSNAAINLSNQISAMSKNQLLKYLSSLDNVETLDIDMVTHNLQFYSEISDHANAYLVKEFLQVRERK